MGASLKTPRFLMGHWVQDAITNGDRGCSKEASCEEGSLVPYQQTIICNFTALVCSLYFPICHVSLYSYPPLHLLLSPRFFLTLLVFVQFSFSHFPMMELSFTSFVLNIFAVFYQVKRTSMFVLFFIKEEKLFFFFFAFM